MMYECTFCPYAGNIFALKHLTVIKKSWGIFTRLVKFVVHAIIFRFFSSFDALSVEMKID
jgi:hypothetical protein